MSEMAAGALVRRKRDGRQGRIQRAEWASNVHDEPFRVVVFEGVVHLPSDFEVIPDPRQPKEVNR